MENYLSQVSWKDFMFIVHVIIKGWSILDLIDAFPRKVSWMDFLFIVHIIVRAWSMLDLIDAFPRNVNYAGKVAQD